MIFSYISFVNAYDVLAKQMEVIKMNKALIAIDSGKYATKAVLEFNRKQYVSVFRTKVQRVQDIGIEIPTNSFLVNFENQQYLIGDVVSEDFSDYNLSKEIINHKLAIYTAIVDLERKAGIDLRIVQVHVIVNAPINVYKEAKAKESYHDFIFNGGKPVRIIVNNKVYTFKSKSLIIGFEGVGLVFNEPKEYANTNTSVIDIGGLNTTYCDFNGLKPDFNSMSVSSLGTSLLKSQLGNAIADKYGISVSSNDLENILLDGNLIHEGHLIKGSKYLITEIKESHLLAIINRARKIGYTFNNRKVAFVGGGSVLLSDQIEKYFPMAHIVTNPQFANLKSFLSILRVKIIDE